MSNKQPADLSQPQRDRFAYMEWRARFVGGIRGRGLVTGFGVQSAVDTRVLTPYKPFAPGSVEDDFKAKSHVLGPHFRPVFAFPPERVPHRDQPRTEINEMDCATQSGLLRTMLRAATAGYTSRQRSVDGSPDHRLGGHEYRLWLHAHLAFYGVKSAVPAAEYVAPHQIKGQAIG